MGITIFFWATVIISNSLASVKLARTLSLSYFTLMGIGLTAFSRSFCCSVALTSLNLTGTSMPLILATSALRDAPAPCANCKEIAADKLNDASSAI